MQEESARRVILVVGACGLDRLLTVPKFPEADAKIRTTAYHEIGGGNAANTAAAIGRLKTASFIPYRNITVKYLGKVGRDDVGWRLLEELKECNVDTSSPLCLQGAPGSTTSFTTIIVSEQEHTRTCLHTPGSCGELCVEDCLKADMDIVFENVFHMHSDARHTSASLFLAKEAKARGIPVSCDCEKDRNDACLDELLQISDLVFTNSGFLGDYLVRLTKELEEVHDVMLQKQLPDIESVGGINESTASIIAKSLIPSAFLARWYPLPGRNVVVTQGSMGALQYQLANLKVVDDCHDTLNEVLITESAKEEDDIFRVKHRYSSSPRIPTTNRSFVAESDYLVHSSGVLRNVSVVDTTGAGDAFIGAYLVAILASTEPNADMSPNETDLQCYNVALAMSLGSWVAGKKLEGAGVREALPMGQDVDDNLGTDMASVQSQLRRIISPFNA